MCLGFRFFWGGVAGGGLGADSHSVCGQAVSWRSDGFAPRCNRAFRTKNGHVKRSFCIQRGINYLFDD